MTHRFDILKAEIFARSREKTNWYRAQMEWKWAGFRTKPKTHCLCTMEIQNIHYLRHRETGEKVKIGCVCIYRFMNRNTELVEDAQRAEYERVRHVCDRCAEYTIHPEYCKKCEKDMKKLEEGWHECNSYACVKVVKEPGYCKKCTEYLKIEEQKRRLEYIRNEAERKRIEAERRRIESEGRAARQAQERREYQERCAREAREYQERVAREKQERNEKWNKVESMINMERLNEIERQFVTESVRNCCLSGKKLSDKQKAWLQKIMLKHPARR